MPGGLYINVYDFVFDLDAMLTGCEHGNRYATVTSSGIAQSCDAWVTQDPWKCYNNWWNTNCCASCAQIKNSQMTGMT